MKSQQTENNAPRVEGEGLPAGNQPARQADKELIHDRFETSFAEYDRMASTQRRICGELVAELEKLPLGDVRSIFEIGAGTGFLTCDLVRLYPGARWYLNDLVEAAGKFLCRYVPAEDSEWLWGDAEAIDYPSGLDLVASSCTIQWFGDMPAFAARAAAATNKGGWIALTTFGPENFREIRATTGEGLDYRTPEQMASIFEAAGYRIQLVRQWEEVLRFEDPSSVLKYIKATGLNSVKKAKWGHERFLRFESDYKRLFPAEGGGVTLTFHPMILIGQKL